MPVRSTLRCRRWRDPPWDVERIDDGEAGAVLLGEGNDLGAGDGEVTARLGWRIRLGDGAARVARAAEHRRHRRHRPTPATMLARLTLRCRTLARPTLGGCVDDGATRSISSVESQRASTRSRRRQVARMLAAPRDGAVSAKTPRHGEVRGPLSESESLADGDRYDQQSCECNDDSYIAARATHLGIRNEDVCVCFKSWARQWNSDVLLERSAGLAPRHGDARSADSGRSRVSRAGTGCSTWTTRVGLEFGR
jgi:hypothetical protein